MIDTPLPGREELLKGCEQHCIHEERDAMYKVATFLFCKKIREVARVIQGYIEQSEKTLIKSIDEYNYSKYTKHWI